MALNEQVKGFWFTIASVVVPFVVAGAGCSPSTKVDCSQGCDPLIVRLCDNQVLNKKTGGQIYGRVDNYSTLMPKKITLIYGNANSQEAVQIIGLNKVKFLEMKPDKCIISDYASLNSRYFIIDIEPAIAMAFVAVPFNATLTLKYLDADESGTARTRREADAEPVRLRSPISPVPIVAGDSLPTIEKIGFTGDRLLSLRAADEAMTLKKRIVQYTLTSLSLTPDALPMGFVFANALPTALPTAAFTADRVVWLELVAQSMTGLPLGMALQSCPLLAASKADCANPASAGYPNNLLPLDYKAFALSPTADRAAVVLADGMLLTAPLSAQSANPPPLIWAAPVGQPPVGRKEQVLLAAGDLNADRQADLVVLHKDASGQDVSVYLGQTATRDWQYDAATSMAWQKAMGGPAASALGLGDLDSDGRAEVVTGSGATVSVWQTASDATPPFLAWSTDLPATAGTVQALAIGTTQDRGSRALVVASSTVPDAMGKVSQFLQAFLPQ